MSEHIGNVDHEDLTVRVEDYSGDDWGDHVIHIASPSWMEHVVPTDPERAVFTLSTHEALELIELLARAVREAD